MLARLFFWVSLLGTLLAAGPVASASAQEADSSRADATETAAPRRIRMPGSDTLRTAPPGAAQQLPADTTAPAGGAFPDRGAQGTAPPENAVQFSARDSLVIAFDTEEGDVGTLYGNAQMTFGEASLSAYSISILSEIDELRALGPPSDTATVGRPQFQRGQGESFTGTSLAFNLRTERGRVVGAHSAIQDGFVQGEVVKVLEDSTLFVKDGSYTTCDCLPTETPSYSLRSQRMKIDGKWVYTGPIQLYIFNIPMPLWLPFGFLPATEGRRSGPLAPRYGEDERGFFLRGFGWYQAISDYMDLQVTGGIWTQGSYEISPLYRYNKRYNYSGRLQFTYLRSKSSGDFVDDGFAVRQDASLRWNHQQTINPTTNLNGSVNLSSSNFLRTVSESFNDNVRQQISSNIRFDKRWPSVGRSFDLALSQTQQLSTGEATLTLPDISFTQSSFKPFERERRGPGQDEAWYERITTSYGGSLENDYRFNPLDTTATGEPVDIAWYEALFSPRKYERATGDEGSPFDLTARHRIPVSAPFSISRVPLLGNLRLNVSPSFNYRETWLIETKRRVTVLDTTATGAPNGLREIVRDDPGFFADRFFSTGVSANTTFYGIFPVRVGAFSGVRHTVRPNLGFSYTPDFNADFWGNTRTFINADGQVERYNVVTGNVIRNTRAQRSLSFRLDNDFETRRVTVDSTGREDTRSLKLLDASLNTNYNFAADSLRLGNISVSMRSNFLEEFKPGFVDRFSLRLNMQLSPYVFVDGRPTRRFIATEPGGFLRLVRLNSLNFSADTGLQGGRRGGQGERRGPRTAGPGLVEPFEPTGAEPFDQREHGAFGSARGQFTDRYADFSIPWSLDLSFSYRLTNGRTRTSSAILDASFDFNLTPKWKVAGNTGYDLSAGDLSFTTLNISRDLECWQMSFSWVPFGPRQSYGFSLFVKSGKLRDLLRVDVPQSGIKNRFGGLIQQ